MNVITLVKATGTKDNEEKEKEFNADALWLFGIQLLPDVKKINHCLKRVSATKNYLEICFVVCDKNNRKEKILCVFENFGFSASGWESSMTSPL